MTWTLPKQPHERFRRNPLAAVIIQLRFDPILKVGSGVPEFQDRIRKRFPRYEEREVQAIDIQGVTDVRMRRVREHRFTARGEATTVTLGDQSVSVEYLDHRHRDVLFRDVASVFGAMTDAYQNVSPTRLGLRYVNVIRRDAISEELKRPLEWADLLNDSFLQIPARLADLDGTRFANELTSCMTVGAMTLRYGLLPTGEGADAFRLDIDRYREEYFDVQIVEDLVKGFADDIFRVFRVAAGPSLVEWMGPEDA